MIGITIRWVNRRDADRTAFKKLSFAKIYDQGYHFDGLPSGS